MRWECEVGGIAILNDIIGDWRLWIILHDMIFVLFAYFRWKQIDKKTSKS
jgi:hypothetical protein